MAQRKVPFGIEATVAHSKSKPKEKIPDSVYENCVSEKLQKTALNVHLSNDELLTLLQHLFDPQDFSRYWRKYSENHKVACLRALRIIVQMQTIEACLKGRYILPDGNTVQLDKKLLEKAAISSVMYSSDFVYSNSNKFKSSRQFVTETMVVEGDCLEAALWLKNTKKVNPAVLNMASTSKPNGGYLSGSGAQEENLTRRTNYFQCLDDPYGVTLKTRKWNYPLPEFGGIYSRDVYVFRRSEEKGYSFMEVPEPLSFVAVSAYSNPPTEEVGEKIVLSKKIAQHTRHKIQTIFNIALENGHDSIVLSAFGCGAYLNPPYHIAELFKEVLNSEFKSCFKFVMFAIFNDHNSINYVNKTGNVLPFAETFKTSAIKLSELTNDEPVEIVKEDPEIKKIVEQLEENGIVEGKEEEPI